MPATITHAYFSKDVYDVLPENIQGKIDLKRLKMFGQSVDSLQFYNLFSVLPGKDIRNFHYYFHDNKSQEFFINLIRYISVNNLSDDKDVCSFLAGFICHYVLDSTVHPYVLYKTGKFDKKDKNTYKYNNLHAFMETFIDNDMVMRREESNPYRYHIGRECFDLKPFSHKLNKTIDFAFKKTFDVENMSKIYIKSLKQMRTALVLFRRDPIGLKRDIYKLVDTFTPKSCYRFEAISYYYPLKDRHNFLNSDNKLWRNPTTYNMTSNESFVDLYMKAIKQAQVLICASFDYINNKAVDLGQIYTNKSYYSGLDCDDKRLYKYFEY